MNDIKPKKGQSAVYDPTSPTGFRWDYHAELDENDKIKSKNLRGVAIYNQPDAPTDQEHNDVWIKQ